MNVVDRRPNPKGKSLSNRRRFLDRSRAEVKRAISDAIRKRSVTGATTGGEKITIPTGGIAEPTFHHDPRTGRHDHVVPGNKEYVRGDEIPRPQGGGDGSGNQGSPDGSGQDTFEFTLTKEEFLDMFFDDLELPDLTRKSLKDTQSFQLQRAGYTTTENGNLSVPRTMQKSMARRIALKRPKLSDIDKKNEEIRAAHEELDALKANGATLTEIEEANQKIRTKQEELVVIERRRKVVGYIDPIDVRYRNFERKPKPNTEAVMFCLMDVSGSMTEAMKDLAKRFFMLLHYFLERRYGAGKVDVVFIRHTSTADEVDEETFFYSRETGGTVVSTALEKMLEVARAHYPTDRYNIYGAQASDGDNYGADSGQCTALLSGRVLPMCQYFAYVEVSGTSGLSRDSDLWRAYAQVPQTSSFAMKKVGDPNQIFAVFHELFSKNKIPIAAFSADPTIPTKHAAKTAFRVDFG